METTATNYNYDLYFKQLEDYGRNAFMDKDYIKFNIDDDYIYDSDANVELPDNEYNCFGGKISLINEYVNYDSLMYGSDTSFSVQGLMDMVLNGKPPNMKELVKMLNLNKGRKIPKNPEVAALTTAIKNDILYGLMINMGQPAVANCLNRLRTMAGPLYNKLVNMLYVVQERIFHNGTLRSMLLFFDRKSERGNFVDLAFSVVLYLMLRYSKVALEAFITTYKQDLVALAKKKLKNPVQNKKKGNLKKDAGKIGAVFVSSMLHMFKQEVMNNMPMQVKVVIKTASIVIPIDKILNGLIKNAANFVQSTIAPLVSKLFGFLDVFTNVANQLDFKFFYELITALGGISSFISAPPVLLGAFIASFAVRSLLSLMSKHYFQPIAPMRKTVVPKNKSITNSSQRATGGNNETKNNVIIMLMFWIIVVLSMVIIVVAYVGKSEQSTVYSRFVDN